MPGSTRYQVRPTRMNAVSIREGIIRFQNALPLLYDDYLFSKCFWLHRVLLEALRALMEVIILWSCLKRWGWFEPNKSTVIYLSKSGIFTWANDQSMACSLVVILSLVGQQREESHARSIWKFFSPHYCRTPWLLLWWCFQNFIDPDDSQIYPGVISHWSSG